MNPRIKAFQRGGKISEGLRERFPNLLEMSTEHQRLIQECKAAIDRFKIGSEVYLYRLAVAKIKAAEAAGVIGLEALKAELGSLMGDKVQKCMQGMTRYGRDERYDAYKGASYDTRYDAYERALAIVAVVKEEGMEWEDLARIVEEGRISLRMPTVAERKGQVEDDEMFEERLNL